LSGQCTLGLHGLDVWLGAPAVSEEAADVRRYAVPESSIDRRY